MAWGNNPAIQQKMQQPGFNPNAGTSEAQPRQSIQQQPQGQMTPGMGSMAPTMGQKLGQGIQGGMNQRNQMNQGMGQKLGGALGSIFNNPDMMQKIRQGMPSWGMRNPQSPMLPNENRVPMGPSGGSPWEGIINPWKNEYSGGGQGIAPMPDWKSTLNPNIGQGTGSNSRDSSDWLQRHPEEQKPAWWDQLQTMQPDPNRATTQGTGPVPPQQNQLQQVPGASSMQPSGGNIYNPQTNPGGMNLPPEANRITDPRFQNFR